MAAMPDRKFSKPYPQAECIDDHTIFGVDESGLITPPGPNDRYLASLTIGKVYAILGEDRDTGMWRIRDDMGGLYLYPKNRFRLLDSA